MSKDLQKIILNNIRNFITIVGSTVVLLVGCGGGSPLSPHEKPEPQPEPRLQLLEPQGVGSLMPAFDPDIAHYALTCGDGQEGELRVAAPQQALLYFNDRYSAKPAKLSFDGLSALDDIKITVAVGSQRKDYYLHCIPEQFPTISVSEQSDAVDSGFLLLSPRMQDKSYLLILDNNGVPRYRKIVDGVASEFKRHPDGRYSYVRRLGRNEFGHFDNEIVILDAQFSEQTTVRTVGLNHTDNHDFLITPEGNYLLMSYNSAYRDLSPWGLSQSELTRDSVIQEITPDGNVVFEWNSWDHVDVGDCLNHRFPDDYAHINSFQVSADENLVASLRGCSMVLKIERPSGRTLWDLGGFNPEIAIVGDPYNEFCGQHTATLDAENNLLVFDNGGHCNGSREGSYGNFSRAVEYKIDEEAAQASFIRDYSFDGAYSAYTSSGGGVFRTPNGNWLISWSRNVMDVTEVTPSGEIALRMRLFDGENQLRLYRAYREPSLSLPLRVEGTTTFQPFE